MRSTKDLDFLIEEAIKTTGGQMPLDLLAQDEKEAEVLREKLKHRRGAKTITVVIGKTT